MVLQVLIMFASDKRNNSYMYSIMNFSIIYCEKVYSLPKLFLFSAYKFSCEINMLNVGKFL